MFFHISFSQVYTTGGLELARITVINHKLEPVYEQLVKPDKPIIDPNTRLVIPITSPNKL